MTMPYAYQNWQLVSLKHTQPASHISFSCYQLIRRSESNCKKSASRSKTAGRFVSVSFSAIQRKFKHLASRKRHLLYSSQSNGGAHGGNGGKKGNKRPDKDDDDEDSSRYYCAVAFPAFVQAQEISGTSSREYKLDTDGRLQSLEDKDERPFNERCLSLFEGIFLPDGFPQSVTPDYLEFCKWRSIQNIASCFLATMSTQSLLYAAGLGKGAIPSAQLINWVIKDGVGYFTKVFFGSKFGARFDDDPKRWRLGADVLEELGMAIEVVAPLVPQQFLFMASLANASKSIATMIQSATRNAFYKSFSKRENMGDITAKGEAQVMSCKLIGMAAGIRLTELLRTNTNLRIGIYTLVATVHFFSNLLSYQVVELTTLNRSRTNVLVEEYLKNKVVMTPHEVNALDRIFNPLALIFPHERYRVHLGTRISKFVDDADQLCSLTRMFHYPTHKYMINVQRGKDIEIVYAEDASPRDIVKSFFQSKVLCDLLGKRSARPSQEEIDQALQTSYRITDSSFDAFERELEDKGWTTRTVLLGVGRNRIRNLSNPCGASS
mmetsp:Transcript_53559/g.89017  ORF Transcript_53559/g.89017 Transcript_53559/m.89017 type:complete len:549 (-) Transcript_53559:529-2175(-)